MSIKDFKGVVHSVFESSFNILDDQQQLITVLNAGKPMSPNAVKIDGSVSFKNLNIKTNQNVYFSKTRICIEELDLIFTCSGPKPWNKQPNLSFCKDKEQNIRSKFRKMENTIHNGNKDGIYPLIQSVLWYHGGIIGYREAFIKDRFISFIEAYIHEDMDQLPSRVRDIIGYGVGLTPSMDDFISGMMIARIYFHYYLDLKMKDAYQLNRAIVEKVKRRTTIISEAMLQHASMGMANEYIRDMMVSFLGKSSINVFIRDLKRVVCIGETSGTDLLLGIYIGGCIMMLNQRWVG